MQFSLEDLATALPGYLSRGDKQAIVENIRQFQVSRILKQFYFSTQDAEPLQGDVWRGVDVFHPETGQRKRIQAMVMSNSCDIAGGNVRYLPPRVTFAAVIRLAQYRDLLQRHGLAADRLEDHLRQVRAQEVSNLFHLPAGALLPEDSVAVLHEAHSTPVKTLVTGGQCTRLACLSQVAFYLFLVKLSVHFCRYMEDVPRSVQAAAATDGPQTLAG